MTIILAIFLLFISIISYNKYRDYFAPQVLSSVSWGGILFMYSVYNHGMQDLSVKVLFITAFWNLGILLGATLFSNYRIGATSIHIYKPFNPWVKNMLFYISCIGMPPLMYMAYKRGVSMDAGSFLLNLRLADTGLVETEYDYGIFKYVMPIILIAFLIELYDYNRKLNKGRLFVLLLFNVIIMVITMAKSTILFTVFSSLVVLGYRHKISSKKVISIGLGIFMMMSAFQLLRTTKIDSTNEILADMFNVYVFGGIPALDQIVNSEMKSQRKGQTTLALYYNIKSKLANNKEAEKGYIKDITDNGYLYVPKPTNVYTMIGPFWLDFKWYGVIIFSFIIGAISGFCYKLSRKGVLWAMLVYSYLAPVLMLQFFGEYVFTNMSYSVQIVFWSLLAHKFKYKIVWKKSTYCSPRTMERNI